MDFRFSDLFLVENVVIIIIIISGTRLPGLSYMAVKRLLLILLLLLLLNEGKLCDHC